MGGEGTPVFPLTLIFSSKNFSNEAMSMILSSTGFVQSMTNVWLFFLPLPAGAAGFFVGATITAHRSARWPACRDVTVQQQTTRDQSICCMSCQPRQARALAMC